MYKTRDFSFYRFKLKIKRWILVDIRFPTLADWYWDAVSRFSSCFYFICTFIDFIFVFDVINMIVISRSWYGDERILYWCKIPQTTTEKKICTQNNKLCCERERHEYVMQTGFSRFFVRCPFYLSVSVQCTQRYRAPIYVQRTYQTHNVLFHMVQARTPLNRVSWSRPVVFYSFFGFFLCLILLHGFSCRKISSCFIIRPYLN